MAVDPQKIERFFAEYEARTNRALAEPPVVDVEETASAFAGCFVAATPNGVTCGKNDQGLRTVIPQGYEFYRSIGTKSMRIVFLEITTLDDYHVQAKAHWQALYQKKDGSEERIDFDVIYFVQTIGEQPRIFAYVTGDEQKLYQEKGLVPS
jgi:hypothetical protein